RAIPILEPGLGTGVVMAQRPLHHGGVVDRNSAEEIDVTPRSVDVDGVSDEMSYLMEQLHLIDESTMPAQPRICREPQCIAASIGEVRGRVDERYYPGWCRMRPGLRHEVPVEVRLSASHLGIHRSGPHEVRAGCDVTGTRHHGVFGALPRKR